MALHSGIDDRRKEDPDYSGNKDGKDEATYPQHLNQHYPTKGIDACLPPSVEPSRSTPGSSPTQRTVSRPFTSPDTPPPRPRTPRRTCDPELPPRLRGSSTPPLTQSACNRRTKKIDTAALPRDGMPPAPVRSRRRRRPAAAGWCAAGGSWSAWRRPRGTHIQDK